MKDGECDTSNKCHCIPSIEIYAVNCRVLNDFFLLGCLVFFFNVQESGVNKYVTAVTDL